MGIVKDFAELKKKRQTLEIVDDLASDAQNVEKRRGFRMFHFSLFFNFSLFSCSFFHSFIFSSSFSYSFFLFSVVRAHAKTRKKSREVLIVKMTIFFCEK